MTRRRVQADDDDDADAAGERDSQPFLAECEDLILEIQEAKEAKEAKEAANVEEVAEPPAAAPAPVSYTHLTLPTILLV